MTREDIVRMAKEAGFVTLSINEDTWIPYLARFATLVASAEREACADIAENWNSNGFPRVGVAAQIRARGQA